MWSQPFEDLGESMLVEGISYLRAQRQKWIYTRNKRSPGWQNVIRKGPVWLWGVDRDQLREDVVGHRRKSSHAGYEGSSTGPGLCVTGSIMAVQRIMGSTSLERASFSGTSEPRRDMADGTRWAMAITLGEVQGWNIHSSKTSAYLLSFWVVSPH